MIVVHSEQIHKYIIVICCFIISIYFKIKNRTNCDAQYILFVDSPNKSLISKGKLEERRTVIFLCAKLLKSLLKSWTDIDAMKDCRYISS